MGMENENIQFTKPSGFIPKKVIKLKEKAGYGSNLFLLSFFVFGTIALFLSDDAGFYERLFMGFFSPPIILFLSYHLLLRYKVNKTLNVLEISDDGIWNNYHNLYIPKERFYKAYRDIELVNLKFAGQAGHLDNVAGKMKLDRVHISFMVNKSEYWKLLFRIGFRNKYKLSHACTLVEIFVPFTRGKGQDIELDILKDNLVKELNILSQDIDFGEYGDVGQDLRDFMTITPKTYFRSETEQRNIAANQK